MSVVIIPAYKPDVAITEQLWAYGCQMVVVDDGSGEEYQKIFDKVRDICIVLHHSENRGKGAAIKTALIYIKNELWDSGLVGIMDCDGQHLPEDMMKLLEFAGAHRKALVLGVRTVGAETAGSGGRRSKSPAGLCRYLFSHEAERCGKGVRQHDAGSGRFVCQDTGNFTSNQRAAILSRMSVENEAILTEKM